MNTIGFENLRSLRTTPDLTIKPINIFVGANSSGKSTFLRALPLLKQSVEARKTGPLLWYGRLVDFGSFKEAVFKNDESLPIRLRFSFSYTREFDSDGFLDEAHFQSENFAPRNIAISLDISVADNEFRGYVSRLIVETETDKIELSLNNELGIVSGVMYNGSDVATLFPRVSFIERSAIIPSIGRYIERPMYRGEGQVQTARLWSSTIIDDGRIVDLLKPYFSGRTKGATISYFLKRLSYGTNAEIIKRIEGGVGSQRILKKRVKALVSDEQVLAELRQHLAFAELPQWLSAANEEISRFASSVAYIAPVRASTERFYRVQDLAIDEVDPQGGNIPMFLQALTRRERDDLSNWLTNHFRFSVDAEYSDGHVSLRYKDPDQDRYYNLADMGFGFSQILPILVQIWHQRRKNVFRREMPRNRVFAIEQPELHLHPRLQAQFADLLSSVIRHEGIGSRQMKFVIETHSEAIINRFGALIRDKLLDANEVNVVVFDRDPKTQETSMRIASYDNNGFLQNWPYGFFAADPA